MTVVGCVPFDAAWQFDAVVPIEENSLPFPPDGLDVEDRIDVFSCNDTSLSHHEMHDYIEPLPFIDCSSPSESFYAASRRHSGCSVSNDEVTLPPSNIRFVSPMQNRDRRVTKGNDGRVSKVKSNIDLPKQQAQKRRRIEDSKPVANVVASKAFTDSKPFADSKPVPVPICPKSENIHDEQRKVKNDEHSESDGSSYDDNKASGYDYYEYSRRDALYQYPDDHFHRGYYDQYTRDFSPQTYHITRERMISFMHRSEETRSEVLAHLRSFPLDSHIRVRTDEENFHGTRASTSALFHSWCIHPEDQYP